MSLCFRAEIQIMIKYWLFIYSKYLEVLHEIGVNFSASIGVMMVLTIIIFVVSYYYYTCIYNIHICVYMYIFIDVYVPVHVCIYIFLHFFSKLFYTCSFCIVIFFLLLFYVLFIYIFCSANQRYLHKGSVITSHLTVNCFSFSDLQTECQGVCVKYVLLKVCGH